MTYDGATLRLYRERDAGREQAKTGTIATSTNPLQIGGDSIYGQYFSGLIDEVRDLQRRPDRSADPGRHDDAGRHRARRHDAAVGAGDADRDRGRARRDRPELGRGDRQRRRRRLPDRALPGRRLHQFSPDRAAAGQRTTYNDTGLAAGTSYSYRVRADRRGRQPRPLLQCTASATTAQGGDGQLPSAPEDVDGDRVRASTGDESELGRGEDNVGVTGYKVERSRAPASSIFGQVGTPTSIPRRLGADGGYELQLSRPAPTRPATSALRRHRGADDGAGRRRRCLRRRGR